MQENFTVNDTEKKLNETEIVFILDRSGSMQSVIKPTVDGFNNFLKEQRACEGEAYVTLVQFDSRDHYEITYKSLPINEVPDLIAGETYIPNGYTALLDAIGKTINELKTDRDVVFVIITDGEENNSKEYKIEAIKKMIESLETEKGYKFLYLGANQDAISVASGFGVKSTNSMSFAANDSGVGATYNSLNDNLTTYRSAKSHLYRSAATMDTMEFEQELSDISAKLNFNDEQRKKSN